MNGWIKLTGSFIVLFWNASFLVQAAAPFPTALSTNILEIRSLTVKGKAIPFQPEGKVSLGLSPANIFFGFGPGSNSSRGPIRLRHQLVGYDDRWHKGNGYMFLAIRFYNKGGDQIDQKLFPASGDSAGWTGDLRTSPFAHRHETIVVPPEATRLLMVISSAGPPAAQGLFVVDHLMVSTVSDSDERKAVLRAPFDRQSTSIDTNQIPSGWVRDGNHPSMARIVEVGPDSGTKAFAIIDEDPLCHAEWHNAVERSPKVTPGDHLEVDWNEMFSIGVGDARLAGYDSLPHGDYRFLVEEVNVMGVPTGAHAALAIHVPQPVWKEQWFLWSGGLLTTAGIFATARYSIGRRMRRELLHLENQNLLERERLRIAHDIHDDLGARVTQISLLSAMAQNDPAFPEKARAEFDRISMMSRELVSALYETVWAVNPENDHLESLGNYLCQMVSQMCDRGELRCRFHVQDLPPGIQISSQCRHNISMAVKEAVHNVIKHSKASEFTLRLSFKDNLLTISIEDNGCGFKPGEVKTGHGLSNMTQRLKEIGGTCAVDTQSGRGTTVSLILSIKPFHMKSGG